MSASGDDRLEDARRYLGADGIIWRSLAGTAIGSLILAWAAGVSDWIFLLIGGPSRFISGALAFIREGLVLLFQLPIPGLDSGFREARDELLAINAGPLTFALGVGLVVAWFWLVSVMIDRLEVA